MIARLNVFFSQRYGGTKLAETEAPQQDVQQQRAGGSAERAWLRPAETVRDWIAVITRIRRTTDSCRRGTMATPRYLEGVLDKSPRERIPPAPIHIDIGWRDVLRKEDDTMRRMLMPTNSGQKSVRFEGGGAPAQERKGLAAFCKTVRDEQGGKGWAVACRDPAVAAAMRHLRQRVQTLSIPEKAVEPSEWAHRVFNGRYGRPRPPRQQEFRTSKVHPLAYAELFPAPVFQRQAVEGTSLWCKSWGMSANAAPVDLTFRYDKEAFNRCG